MSVKSLVRRWIHGASWRNPILNAGLHAADPADYIVRRLRGYHSLPPYSIRVRSVGVRGDIGGTKFVQGGKQITAMLQKYAFLTPNSNVLEIGCGCGRTAITLADVLEDGNYTGMDIERVALESARNNRLLQRKRFSFELLDVQNALYNPEGRYRATEYVFPHAQGTFDLIFMTSVFTHMLTEEVQNYSKEIARVLKPGGRCYVTAFLLDRPMEKPFPFKSKEHSYSDEACPEIAVAYHLEFLSSTFSANGMTITTGPLWGTVHGGVAEAEDYQDLLVFTKDK
jgi:SAM-dependent methyltransferase